MACTQTSSCNPCGTCGKRGSGYLLVIVLYILLAILISSYFC